MGETMEDKVTERELLELTPRERTEIREVRLLQERREAWTGIREARKKGEKARFLALTREEQDDYLADLAAFRGERNVR